MASNPEGDERDSHSVTIQTRNMSLLRRRTRAKGVGHKGPAADVVVITPAPDSMSQFDDTPIEYAPPDDVTI